MAALVPHPLDESVQQHHIAWAIAAAVARR